MVASWRRKKVVRAKLLEVRSHYKSRDNLAEPDRDKVSPGKP
jgi:hypothetical protein